MTSNAVEEAVQNGLPCVTLKHTSGASALVFVYAAHLASWKSSSGEEELFVSSATEYGGGKAIRGGVPVCWPQFADRGPYGKHGFARNSDKWKIVRTSTEPYPTVVLGLTDDEATRAAWPFPFEVRYSVTLDGPDSVSTSLTVINTSDKETMEFTTALHTYFRCPKVADVKLLGLQGVTYEDSTKAREKAVQEEEELSIEGEVDRVYLNTPSEAYIVDKPNGRALKILKMGFEDAVVWNIGAERAGGLKDLGAGEWQNYVCYEAAKIGKPAKLGPKTSWTAGQTFTRLPLSALPTPSCSK